MGDPEISADIKSNQLETAIRSETVTVGGQAMCLMLTSQGLKLTAAPDQKRTAKPSKHEKSILWCEVIKAETDSEAPGSLMTLHYMEKQKNKSLRLRSVNIKCQGDHVESWVTAIMEECRKVPGRPKKLFVAINPIGGNQKGVDIYHRQVAPVFELAGCETTVIVTERAKHALEIGETQDFSSYDGIIAVSGDGLYQELLQGYFLQLQREAGIDVNDKDAEFVRPKIPFCLIPTGSSNGYSRFTNDGVREVQTSALRVVRGEIHSLNMVIIHEPKKLLGICGLGFGLGFMSDIMKRSDELRWMKKARYAYTFIGGMLKKRKFDCQIQYLLEPGESSEACSGVGLNEGWQLHSAKDSRYAGLMISAGDFKTVGNKCAVDFLGKSGSMLFDTGCSTLSFIKFSLMYDGKPLQRPLPNLEIVNKAVGMRIKILRDEKETDENVSRSRARERELEHYTFCDGEILRMDGLEVEAKLHNSFVPMFGCIPSLLKDA